MRGRVKPGQAALALGSVGAVSSLALMLYHNVGKAYLAEQKEAAKEAVKKVAKRYLPERLHPALETAAGGDNTQKILKELCESMKENTQHVQRLDEALRQRGDRLSTELYRELGESKTAFTLAAQNMSGLNDDINNVINTVKDLSRSGEEAREEQLQTIRDDVGRVEALIKKIQDSIGLASFVDEERLRELELAVGVLDRKGERYAEQLKNIGELATGIKEAIDNNNHKTLEKIRDDLKDDFIKNNKKVLDIRHNELKRLMDNMHNQSESPHPSKIYDIFTCLAADCGQWNQEEHTGVEALKRFVEEHQQAGRREIHSTKEIPAYMKELVQVISEKYYGPEQTRLPSFVRTLSLFVVSQFNELERHWKNDNIHMKNDAISKASEILYPNIKEGKDASEETTQHSKIGGNTQHFKIGGNTFISTLCWVFLVECRKRGALDKVLEMNATIQS